jgi:DNA-3-methyladenine glycosylase II
MGELLARTTGRATDTGSNAKVSSSSTVAGIENRFSYTLKPEPPFRLDLAVWVLRRRPENSIDRWDGRCYRRTLTLEGDPVEVAVMQTQAPETPRLRVVVEGRRAGPAAKPAVTAALERLLGLFIDLREFERFADRDARLGPLVRRFRGMKPTRFPSVFECLVNAIACQQLTLTVGIQLLGRLAAAFGLEASGGQFPGRAFPRPDELAAGSLEDFRVLGFSRAKARALIELAGAVAEGRLELEALATAPDKVAMDCLCRLRGVGRWSAEYVLLRGLGRLHVFPGDDVGARNALQGWLEMPDPLDYEGVQRALAPWQPYVGLIYFHLLLDRLADAGVFAAVDQSGS